MPAYRFQYDEAVRIDSSMRLWFALSCQIISLKLRLSFSRRHWPFNCRSFSSFTGSYPCKQTGFNKILPWKETLVLLLQLFGKTLMCNGPYTTSSLMLFLYYLIHLGLLEKFSRVENSQVHYLAQWAVANHFSDHIFPLYIILFENLEQLILLELLCFCSVLLIYYKR